MENDTQVAAQDPTMQPSDAASASAPSELPAGSPPTTDAAKVERDRLAIAGRERAAAERRAQQAEQVVASQAAELAQLRQTVARIDSTLTARQQAEQEARLAALPSDQRTAAELAILKQQIAEQQQEQAKLNEMRTLIQQANAAFGLTGNLAITGHEQGLDDSSRDTYIASLRNLANARYQKPQPASGSTEGDTTMADKKAKAEPTVEDQIQAGIDKGLQEIRREMGLGRSNAPRAAASGSSEDAETVSTNMRDTLRNYDNRRPGASRQAMAEQAEAAKRLAPGGRR